jgi:hypothetical protein
MFTPPVFLRNYTLCLFNYAYYCGGVCGEGHTILYKKEGNGWKEIQTYFGFVASRFDRNQNRYRIPNVTGIATNW